MTQTNAHVVIVSPRVGYLASALSSSMDASHTVFSTKISISCFDIKQRLHSAAQFDSPFSVITYMLIDILVPIHCFYNWIIGVRLLN